MVLVDPAARGRGVAPTLLQCALRLVGSSAAARLDATPSGEPIYRALGFVRGSPGRSRAPRQG